MPLLAVPRELTEEPAGMLSLDQCRLTQYHPHAFKTLKYKHNNKKKLLTINLIKYTSYLPKGCEFKK